jgi:hypothetical protein
MIGDTARQSHPLRQAAGELIAGYASWTYYATLTFKDFLPQWQATAALKSWSRWLAREHIRAHVKLAYAMEQTKGAGIWHYHVLLDAPVEHETDVPMGVFDRDVAHAKWQASSHAGGFTRFERFEQGGGAANYLSKTASYDLGLLCPRIKSACRRGGRCPDGPDPFV